MASALPPAFLGSLLLLASLCPASEVAEELVVGELEHPPALDGDLSDWPASPATILLGEARHTLPRPGQWGGATDLSGAVRLAWDKDWLYLAAEVVDDNLAQASAEGAEPWQGDSLEVFFNAESGRQDTPCFRQVALVPGLVEGCDLAVLCPQGDFPGVEGRAKTHAQGYTLECRIPWKNLAPFRPGEGARVGFQIMLDDRDKKGRKSQLCWHPSAITYSRPKEMGVLRLGRSPEKPAQVAAGPLAAVVTDPEKMEFSVATITPEARKVRISLANDSGEAPALELPLDFEAGALRAAKGVLAVPGLEGRRSFSVEVLDPSGRVLATDTFEAELAGKRYGQMRAALQSAEKRLAQLPPSANEAILEQRAGVGFWLQRGKALAANEARPESVTSGLLDEMLGELKAIGGALEALERNEDPYAGRTGSFVRAYRSPLTGEFRPHSLFVPESGSPTDLKPLIVVLHGVFGDDRHLFQMLPDIRGLDAIVYQAASYRQFDWSDLSAAETWAGLDRVLAEYPVDRSRISLMGHHIGGRGTLQLAMARPGFFAAAASMYPGVDARPAYRALQVYPQFYERAVDNHIPYPVFKKPDRPSPLEEGVERQVCEKLSLASRAENLAGLPLRMVAGEHDPDASAEELALLDRCDKLGMKIPRAYVPGAMHGSRPPELSDPEFYRWLLSCRKPDAPPEEFEYVCTDLRDNTGWFVRVDAMESPVSPGRLKVARQADRLVFETRGVSGFTPVAAETRLRVGARAGLRIDGQDLGEWSADDLAGRQWVKDAQGRWQEGSPPKESKRHGLSGPIDDFQRDRLLYVYGTSGSVEETALLAKVAKKISNRGLGAEFPCKADKDVTEEDWRSKNLVLIGSPASNSVLNRLEKDLPIRWEGGAYRLGDARVSGSGAGVCFIRPNPLAADRYVVVLSARDEAGYRVWDSRAGVDYVIGAFDGKQFVPELKGLFGNDWSYRPEYSFRPAS